MSTRPVPTITDPSSGPLEDLTQPSGRQPPRRGLQLVASNAEHLDADAPAATLRELTDDLLAGITAPGPVLRTHARRLARLMQRLDTYESLIDRAPHLAGDGVSFLKLQAELGARRDGDDLALHRGMAALDTLRARRLELHATLVRRRSGRRAER